MKLKLRGFKLNRAFKWIILPRRKRACLGQTRKLSAFAKIFAVARFLKRGACKALSGRNSDPGYVKLGEKKTVLDVPKGHLAVYVGDCGGDTRRAVVPVVYFNHPLFVELLKEAERVYGYDYPGGIVIPCGYSEFEKVQMRIAAWDNCHHDGSTN